jgi:hypothetical protein
MSRLAPAGKSDQGDGSSPPVWTTSGGVDRDGRLRRAIHAREGRSQGLVISAADKRPRGNGRAGVGLAGTRPNGNASASVLKTACYRGMGCSSPRACRFASIPAATFGSSDPRLLDIAPSPRWPVPFVGFFVGRASSGTAVKAPPGHCPSAGAGRLQEAGLRTGRAAASTLLATCRPSYSVRGAYRSASSRGTSWRGMRALVIGTNPRDARTCAPKGKFEEAIDQPLQPPGGPWLRACGQRLAPPGPTW